MTMRKTKLAVVMGLAASIFAMAPSAATPGDLCALIPLFYDVASNAETVLHLTNHTDTEITCSVEVYNAYGEFLHGLPFLSLPPHGATVVDVREQAQYLPTIPNWDLAFGLFLVGLLESGEGAPSPNDVGINVDRWRNYWHAVDVIISWTPTKSTNPVSVVSGPFMSTEHYDTEILVLNTSVEEIEAVLQLFERDGALLYEEALWLLPRECYLTTVGEVIQESALKSYSGCFEVSLDHSEASSALAVTRYYYDDRRVHEQQYPLLGTCSVNGATREHQGFPWGSDL